VYRELVEESGWTPEEFEHWVADSLERHLFDHQSEKVGSPRARAGKSATRPRDR